MDLSSVHLSGVWLLAHALYWPVFAFALLRAPWSILRQKDSSNIFFATCVAIFMVWQLKVTVAEGLALHLLGSTILTLMFRWQVAIIANALIVLGATLTSTADFAGFAVNTWITGLLPIAISYLVWRLNEWYLPANYFVYIFVAAFLCGGISILASGFVSYQLLSLVDNLLTQEELDAYLLVFIPMMYPEAFLTGAVITVFVIYKPQWISTFDDQRYLKNK